MIKSIGRAAFLVLLATGAAAAQPGPHFGGPRGWFASLSPEGKTIVWSAMKSLHDGTQDQIEAVRTRELGLLAADRLDVSALSRVMSEECNLAAGMETRKQAALLSAYQRLSVADRRAFVQTARELQARVLEARKAHKAVAGQYTSLGPR